MITIATYDKLVRDRIPEIIEASGKSCRTSISTGEELIQRLQSKLIEEFNEFVESGKDLEELADILEVSTACLSSGLVAWGNHGNKEQEAGQAWGFRKDLPGVGWGLEQVCFLCLGPNIGGGGNVNYDFSWFVSCF